MKYQVCPEGLRDDELQLRVIKRPAESLWLVSRRRAHAPQQGPMKNSQNAIRDGWSFPGVFPGPVSACKAGALVSVMFTFGGYSLGKK